ncbi:hypothetical protein C0Q70_20846 [Pomacea canaliculata]|uniref:Photolyase/cryptochrome alpha/beta domain-containing protein n=1 Tax=Pomacea canaliculata TaxID=400727 RepID=A0A2T7NAU8_POMCA|nr:hypothetical protein C0Q70_20846 [Pomacea canaliculata]
MDKEGSKKTTRIKNQKRKSELDSSESTKKSRSESLPGSKPLDDVDFVQQIAQCRTAACESIEAFKFNKKRVRVLSEAKDCPDEGKGVLYWMSRDQRVQDNWAFLYAQRLALKLKLPLYVCFCLVPNFREATIRQFGFMLKGLAEVEKECRNLDISFYLLMGKAKDVLPEFIKNHHIGGVVTDFSPLRIPSAWVTELSALLPKDVPFCQVDAHNIVPCWVASPKLEYSARTIRSKIHKVLNEYLTEFPPLIKHPHKSPTMPKSVNWEKAAEFLEVDRTVKEVDWAQPGTTGAYHTLATFCNKRLKFYESDRNDPNKEALSDLSPWFHFGQISPQRCVLAVRGFRSRAKESVDAFIEESVIRRELTDNFCFYNENYDSIKGAAKWAQDTLEAHRNDKRAYVYNRQQLEQAKTHDNLWNAAQAVCGLSVEFMIKAGKNAQSLGRSGI